MASLFCSASRSVSAFSWSARRAGSSWSIECRLGPPCSLRSSCSLVSPSRACSFFDGSSFASAVLLERENREVRAWVECRDRRCFCAIARPKAGAGGITAALGRVVLVCSFCERGEGIGGTG